MGDKPKIVKMEWLMTRDCNANCSGCQIIHPKWELNPIMSISQIATAIDIVYDKNKLNGSFIAGYGGEPLILGRKKLGEIIRILSSYRPKKSYTIISNSIGLTEKDMDYFISKGLDSWTSSVDCLSNGITYDRYSEVKSKAGIKALMGFKEKGLRDVCGIITINKKNLLQVLETVRFLSDRKIWVGLDFIHYNSPQRLNGLDNKCSNKDDMLDYVFNDNDINNIRKLSEELIKMKKQGGLIFPTFKTLEGWKDPQNSIYLNWSCKSFKKPYSIMMDQDGSLGCCDQFAPPEIRKYSIFDMPQKWNDFSKQYIKSVKERNCRCFWGTHYCLDEIANTKEGIEYYQHERTTN